MGRLSSRGSSSGRRDRRTRCGRRRPPRRRVGRWVIRPSSDRRPDSTSALAAARSVVLPLRGDADARLAHEGGREGEGERLGVEAGQHDLAARRQARDQRVEDRGVAADVADRGVVAPRVRGRVEDAVADGAGARGRGCAPRPWARRRPGPRGGPAGGRARRGRRSARVARGAGDGVLRGRRQGEQHAALAQGLVDRQRRSPGTTTREAAPPNRPRTSPKQRAPGTKTRSPTRREELGPASATRPTDS